MLKGQIHINLNEYMIKNWEVSKADLRAVLENSSLDLNKRSFAIIKPAGNDTELYPSRICPGEWGLYICSTLDMIKGGFFFPAPDVKFKSAQKKHTKVICLGHDILCLGS